MGYKKDILPFQPMDLDPRVLNHGGAVHGIRNLLRYGIDCKAIVWNQATEKCTFSDAMRHWRCHARYRVILSPTSSLENETKKRHKFAFI